MACLDVLAGIGARGGAVLQHAGERQEVRGEEAELRVADVRLEQRQQPQAQLRLLLEADGEVGKENARTHRRDRRADRVLEIAPEGESLLTNRVSHAAAQTVRGRTRVS